MAKYWIVCQEYHNDGNVVVWIEERENDTIQTKTAKNYDYYEDAFSHIQQARLYAKDCKKA